MMKRIHFYLGGVIFALFFVGQFFALTPVVHAEGLRISPLTFEMSANPGDTISNVIEIYNTENEEAVVTDEINETFSLAKWMIIAPQELILGPLERAAVTFTIQIPQNAEPGGHYGTVLATISGQPGGGVAAISQKIGSLLLLQVAGAVQEQMWIKSL